MGNVHPHRTGVPEVVAVVLAAGASSRMGSPKALLSWEGRSFVGCCVNLAVTAGCSRCAVVTGAVRIADTQISSCVQVHNSQWRRGPLSSLQAGLLWALEGAADGILVLTVDRPHLAPTTVRELISAFEQAPGGMWQPVFAGRWGHPIIFPRALAAALLQLPPEANRRQLIAAAPWRNHRYGLAVADPAILDNLDRPEDVARARLRVASEG